MLGAIKQPEELEEMGEDTDGLCKSSSKLREELMKLSGVDIMKDD